ncbi:MAG: imidazolonepropionase [bacterium]
MIQADVVVKNCAEIATPLGGRKFGPGQFQTIPDGAVAAFEGTIVFVGKTGDLRTQVELADGGTTIDAAGKVVTPGFIDCHTHPIFADTRENEFAMRLEGKSYEEIALAGGGIRSSVRSLRDMSKDDLIARVLPRLNRFLQYGTTTIEAKSGYGLSLEDELKSLEVIHEVDKIHPVDLVPTFLGAHETPDEFRGNKSGYVDLVIHDMMPEVKARGLAEFCDIFCESHVFSVEESRKILSAAKDIGFKLKIHADQLGKNGGAALAADLDATSADHLEYTDENDWRKMLDHKVIPVLLPGAVFFLAKERYAQARQMRDAGLPLALATDFNPGTCMSESMPLILTLACLKLKLRPFEALSAATLHAAMAIDRGNLLGSLEVGKKADLVIWDAPNHSYIPYHFGVNLVSAVVKSGKVVYEMNC